MPALLLILTVARDAAATPLLYTIDFEQFADGDPIETVSTPFGDVTFSGATAEVSSWASSGSVIMAAGYDRVAFPHGIVGFSVHFFDTEANISRYAVYWPMIYLEGILRGGLSELVCPLGVDDTCLLDWIDYDAVEFCMSIDEHLRPDDCSTAEWGGFEPGSFDWAGVDDLTLAVAPEPTTGTLFLLGMTATCLVSGHRRRVGCQPGPADRRGSWWGD